MKKIKKLTLNKEVVSILGGNDMNLVKGGTYTDPAIGTCVTCATAVGCAGGNNPGTIGNTCVATCLMTCGTCNGTCGNTCATCNTICVGTCQNTCITCNINTCGPTCQTCQTMCYNC